MGTEGGMGKCSHSSSKCKYFLFVLAVKCKCNPYLLEWLGLMRNLCYVSRAFETESIGVGVRECSGCQICLSSVLNSFLKSSFEHKQGCGLGEEPRTNLSDEGQQ